MLFLGYAEKIELGFVDMGSCDYRLKGNKSLPLLSLHKRCVIRPHRVNLFEKQKVAQIKKTEAMRKIELTYGLHPTPRYCIHLAIAKYNCPGNRNVCAFF